MILEEITAIERESFKTPWDIEMYKDIAKNSDYKIETISDAGQICGYIVMLKMVDVLEIIKIAVAEKYRKRGLASLLIDKAYEAAKENKMDAIWLEVRESNSAARNLYVKKGFEVVGIRKKYYSDTNENGVVMKADIK